MTEIKSGHVHKCGKAVKSWKRRWFVLKSNGYLYYYENKNSKTEKGKVDVVDASKVGEWKEIGTAVKKLPSGFSSNNAFGIVTADRTYTCVCEVDGDSMSWISAINKLRDPDEEQNYPEPTYPKEKKEEEPSPVQVKKEAPLTASNPTPPTSKPAHPTSYGSLPRNAHIEPPPPGTNPNFNTLPNPKPRPKSSMPALPASNPYYTPEVRNQVQATGPPQQPPPQFRPSQPPQPQYQPPPQPQYRPPQQPQYRPPQQPQYRPPQQPQYRHPQPPQPQYRPAQPQYRPPQAQYRAPPPQQGYYRPPPPAAQPYYPRGPYQSYPQRPPPPPAQIQYVPPIRVQQKR